MTPEQKAQFDQMTTLQQRVCVNVLSGGYDSNRAAYFAAGGKAKSNESADAIVARMLGDAKVRPFLSSMKAATVSEAIMSREEAMERLTKAARITITDIAEFGERQVGEDDDGQPIKETVWRIKNSDELTPEAAAAIKSVTATKFGPKLELHDPHAAIKQLADMSGWQAPSKHELSGPGGSAIPIESTVSAPEVAAALEGLMSKL